ncbi:methyltransferase family protein [Nocardia cerradoensis]|uniref:methyltransferase family protein n=1 Tax=Nocardia cerradoensis TaxID=85688 RepID=UPI000685BA24|nr:isoprenylcysteine carboxylmethyltransferase family protein [Nocardia cerradoensis]NKY45047.1 isoprenylcysteine carboxylmethyltransferase family protein [Nocardia cerradoensis]
MGFYRGIEFQGRNPYHHHDCRRGIDRGPYHWVRHPSYTGVLLLTTGFGVAAGNWISLLLLIVVPTLAFLRRIDVEEAAMVETLGRSYEDYRARSRRLVPGVW